MKLLIPLKPLWWSAFHLITSVIEQHEIIAQVIEEDDERCKKYSCHLLTYIELQILKRLAKLLKPLEEVSDLMAGEQYVTASAIMPILMDIESDLKQITDESKQENDDESLETSVPRKVMKALRKRYNPDATPTSATGRRGIAANLILKTSTYLDPRFRCMLTEADMEECRINILVEILVEVDSVSTGASSSTASLSTTKPRILKGFAKLCAKHAKQSVKPEELARAEMERYEQSEPADSDANVLRWWCERQKVYPKLAALTKKYLCISATSVPSERVFSAAGNIITDRRKRLTGEHAEELTFMSCTKRYVNV